MKERKKIKRETTSMRDIEIQIECSKNKMNWLVVDSSQKSYSGLWQTTNSLTKKELKTILHILENHLDKKE